MRKWYRIFSGVMGRWLFGIFCCLLTAALALYIVDFLKYMGWW